ncbi:hypothetical protein C2S51_012180 [Perilla frutescens var. frutescens]|nr:hypothetical protein C2S51_012180 [Perilla frutescens var. frutescens]
MDMFDNRSRAKMTRFVTREERLWLDFKEYKWAKSIGVERNLLRMLRIWEELRKEGGAWRSLEAGHKVVHLLPNLLKEYGRNFFKDHLDYTPRIGEICHMEKFMDELLSYWEGLVNGHGPQEDVGEQMSSNEVESPSEANNAPFNISN